MGFETLSAEFHAVRRRLSEKQTASEAFLALRHFRREPDQLASLAAAEKAGVLDQALEDLGRRLEERYRKRVERTLTLLPGLLLFAVAIVVVVYIMEVFGALYGFKV